jgi:hypothetical protein
MDVQTLQLNLSVSEELPGLPVLAADSVEKWSNKAD